MHRLLALIVVAIAASTNAAALERQASPAHKAGDIVIEPASVNTDAGEIVRFELGTLYVPENRSDPDSRIIGVGFVRFRTLGTAAAPPTFHLPGGPGSSYVTELTSTSPGSRQILPQQLKEYDSYRRVGDVVLVDQRGFSERGDLLVYRYRLSPQPLDRPGNQADANTAEMEIARSAIAEYQAKGFDLRGYTVKECADDVDDLRKALGYEKISLVGQSFGSQWSFAVMKRHPRIVARALLTGVEPLNNGYDMPSHVFAAIQRMWWEADREPSLQGYLPPGGLMAAATAVLRRLEKATVSVAVEDKRTGKKQTLVLGKEDFQRNFVSLSRFPQELLALYHGRYEEWGQRVLRKNRGGRGGEEILIRPLIDTSLGATAEREYALRTDPATEFIGRGNFAANIATAQVWPTEDVGDDFRREMPSDIPVVFAQGDWDTSTPIENTYGIAPYFANSHVLIAARGGHCVFRSIAIELPDVWEKLIGFLRTGSLEDLPTRVTLKKDPIQAPDFPAPSSARPSTS